MSKSFLTEAQTRTKLGLSGGGAQWIRKSELIATGKCDESLLTGYGNNDYVVDDHIVKKVNLITLFETTYFTCVFSSYKYDTELRFGYYKGNCGSISGFTSTNNWALDTFFLNINNSNSKLVVHRSFNAQNYVAETLTLEVKFLAGYGGQFIEPTYSFKYSWGSTGFQGWIPDNNIEFLDFFKTWCTRCRNVTIKYSGALR